MLTRDNVVYLLQCMCVCVVSPTPFLFHQLQSVQYNLQLLKAMLEVNAVEGVVDEETYSHVIRMWVKDLRDRNGSGSQQPLEVSQLSDSEVRGEVLHPTPGCPLLGWEGWESRALGQ